MYSIRKLDDVQRGIEFDTKWQAIDHAIKANTGAIGVFRNDEELEYIVDCGVVYAPIPYAPDTTDSDTEA